MMPELNQPEDFNEMSSKDKLDSIIERMSIIFRMENMRFWRERFATKEQYKEEFSASYEKDIAVAFALIKNSYTMHFDEINEVAGKIGDNDYLRILKSIVEKDIEDILLKDECVQDN